MTEESLFSNYYTDTATNTTTLIIAAPYTNELFSFDGQYEIVDVIVANSSEQISTTMPHDISLYPSYPTPFNPSTTIKIFIPVEMKIDISVYNLMGQKVDNLHSGSIDSGYNFLSWDANEFSSGIYILKASSSGYVQTQKLMLVK